LIVGLDWDGTLVESFTATPLPGVLTRLVELPVGTKTFIAINQAGPVFRAMLRDAKYPTAQDVAAQIVGGLAALDWRPDLLLVACYPSNMLKADPRWDQAAEQACRELTQLLRDVAPARIISAQPKDRMPRPGMLYAALGEFGETFADMVYVGDMDTDRAAATAAGCRYLDAAAWRAGGIV
jgi:hypothetical protein